MKVVQFYGLYYSSMSFQNLFLNFYNFIAKMKVYLQKIAQKENEQINKIVE